MSDSSTSRPDLWLIRTFQNRLLGPFSGAEVRARVLSRELTAEDEICQANYFWFALHEQVELKAQLGIELPPRARRSDDEITETETETASTNLSNPQEKKPEEIHRAPALRMEVAGGYESTALLRVLAWLLLLGAISLLAWVYIILRSS